ncbi:MAG: RNA polymerase sigma factor RpoD/SigA [Bacteroidota bacterium]
MRALVINHSLTKRTATLDRYLNEIGQIDLLTVQEEVQLGAMVQKGDREAVNRLVQANLRFVVSVAKKYQHTGVSLEDLISEGNIGLIKAAERFDPSKGFKFISFAVWWIRQAIMHSLAEKKRMIRLPGHQLVGIGRINAAAIELGQRLEREPTLGELADYLDLTTDKIVDFKSNEPLTYSLDWEGDGEDSVNLLEVIADDGCEQTDLNLIQSSDKTNVERLLSKLNQRSQLVIRHYYGLDGFPKLTADDIAVKLKVTPERVRQLKGKIIKGLSQRYASSKHQYLME